MHGLPRIYQIRLYLNSICVRRHRNLHIYTHIHTHIYTHIHIFNFFESSFFKFQLLDNGFCVTKDFNKADALKSRKNHEELFLRSYICYGTELYRHDYNNY